MVAAEARRVSVTRREADIALRLVRLTQNELAVRRVGAIGFGVYASADYLERLRQPDFPSGAPGHATVLNPVETMGLPEMVWFAGLTHQAVPAIRHNSRYGHRAAAEAGMGLAMLSRFMGDTARLVRLEPPASQPPRDVFLGVHNDIRHTPRIRAVIDAIAASMRAEAGRLVPHVIENPLAIVMAADAATHELPADVDKVVDGTPAPAMTEGVRPWPGFLRQTAGSTRAGQNGPRHRALPISGTGRSL